MTTNKTEKAEYAAKPVSPDYEAKPDEWYLIYMPGVGMGKSGYPAGKPAGDGMKSQVKPMRGL